MNDELFDDIIHVLIRYANDAAREVAKNPSEFEFGREDAYYEVLDTIKSRLIVAGYSLRKCGLNINLEQKYL